MRTFSTSSVIWDFKRRCFLTETEKLVLHGFPWEAPWGEFTDLQLGQWAGEGTALPCLGAVLLAFFLNRYAPWWKDYDETMVAEQPSKRPRLGDVGGSV